MEITSKLNEKVKYIKSLNEKKYRTRYNSFYIEGVKVISELLDMCEKKAINIEFIAYSIDILKKSNGYEEVLKKIKEKDDTIVYEFSKDVFEYVTDTVNSQGILCVVKADNILNKNVNLHENGNILILDKIQDLGNLGTIIRTASAFNIKNIICTSGTADVLSPKVVRSTMLSILKCNITYTNNIVEIILDLKKNGFKIVSTALSGSKYMTKDTFNSKCAIVLGNEANGISSEILKISDEKIKIKIEDNVESLNVACAASIVLYEQYKNLV